MANVPPDADDHADSATLGAPRHGIAPVRGQQGVPLSPLHEGRFGRMFRDPQPLRPDDAALAALAKLVKESGSAAAGDNAKIPAGYTYLGQFIDHDLTFDPSSSLQRDNDPDALVDFRTPRFDLDCLYGSGPEDDPFMYEWSSPSNRGVKLLVGRNPTANGEFDRDDLPRNQQARALIGDPRNDENIIVSQLQLLFIRFHNKVVDRTRRNQRLAGRRLFEEAQRITRWHYQWIVVHDFLERIVGRQTAQAILRPGTATKPAQTDVRFFSWQNNPFMPVEFSGAAYRYGHSQVRASYDLNDIVTGVPIFASADRPGPLEHLGGFRRLPAVWTIDWSLFFKMTPAGRPQLSRKIDTSIAAPLFKLPGLPGDRPSLPLLNLKRGRALGLPSGQDVAAAIGVPPLSRAQLGLSRIDLPPERRAQLEAATPLWFYLLREAATLGGGERLGMVGGRIVAEVLVGLLAADPQSYLSRRPTWKPILPAAKKGDFTMPDLVRFALG
ncbi:MAG: peroxidase family protein [Thermoleophilia bacterium]